MSWKNDKFLIIVLILSLLLFGGAKLSKMFATPQGTVGTPFAQPPQQAVDAAKAILDVTIQSQEKICLIGLESSPTGAAYLVTQANGDKYVKVVPSLGVDVSILGVYLEDTRVGVLFNDVSGKPEAYNHHMLPIPVYSDANTTVTMDLGGDGELEAICSSTEVPFVSTAPVENSVP